MGYARATLNAYKPRSVVRQYFKTKLPEVKNTLTAAERVCRALGVIVSEFEYKDNIAAIKVVSHLLNRLEKEKWIKIVYGNIYYQPSKEIQIVKDARPEKINIFELIISTIKDVAPYLHSDRDIVSDPKQAEEKCIGKVIFKVDDLTNEAAFPNLQKYSYLSSLFFSPLVERAAEDIAAGILLYKEHEKIYQRPATSAKWLPDTPNAELIGKAQKFEQILSQEVAEAKKLPVSVFWKDFKLKRDKVVKAHEFDPDEAICELISKGNENAVLVKKIGEGQGTHDYKWLFVISDLHFLDYTHRDIFDLLRLISIVKKVNGTLIINGDMIDLWRVSDPLVIIAKNQIFFEALKGIDFIYITGNHDSRLRILSNKNPLGAAVTDRYYIKEGRIFILHGDVFDKWNSKNAVIGEKATGMAKWMEDVIGDKSTKWLEVMHKKMITDSKWQKEKVGKIVEGVDGIYEKYNDEKDPFTPERPLTVIVGHYHFPGDSFAYKEIEKRIEEKYGKKVRFIFAGSWYGREGYAGEVICFGKERQKNGNLFVSTFIWEYPDARALVTLYSDEWRQRLKPI